MYKAKPEAEGSREPRAKIDRDAKEKKPAIRYPFWFGGSASSMAACVTHPLDLASTNATSPGHQVRLQMSHGDAPKTMSGTVVHVVKNNGVSGLYNGLSASLLRQITYSTVRFGVYEDLKMRATKDGKQPSFPVLVAIASTSGVLGGIVGNVADVLNVRMQHDSALPPDQRRNYKNSIDGMIRMAREEGFRSWFRGVWPNSARAAIMTAAQLATYDTFKSVLLRYTPMTDNLTTHFTASVLAGVMAATATSPVDVIKTRVMSSTAHHSIVTVLSDLYKTDGLRWVFKGWTPSFLRLGPQTICTFVFLEAHRKAYRGITGKQ